MFIVALLVACLSVSLGVLPHVAQDRVQKTADAALGHPGAVKVGFQQVPTWKLALGEVQRVWVTSPGATFEGKQIRDIQAQLGPIKPGQPIPADISASFNREALGSIELPGLPDIGLDKLEVSFSPFALSGEAVVMGIIRLPLSVTGDLKVQNGQLFLTSLTGKLGDQAIALPELPIFSPPPGWTIVSAAPHKDSIRLQLQGQIIP